MNYRLYKFFAEHSYGADTTIVEDLNLVDPISSIIIGIKSVNTTNVNTANIVAHLTKIEIVDGSDVLFSLDGREADALDCYNQGGKFRANYNNTLDGNTNERYIGINFGRWLWDPEYALDPKRFINPQIRLSLSILSGGNTPSAVLITMWANLFDQKVVSPGGFLMAKELKSWLSVANTHEYTDLPLDYPYRALYLRAYDPGWDPGQVVSNFKLSEDQDKKIPYDCPAQDIIRAIAENYSPIEETYEAWITLALAYLYVGFGHVVRATAIQRVAAPVLNSIASNGGGGGRLELIASTVAVPAFVHVSGHVPHNVFEIPCGKKDDPADWYDVRRLGSLRADITAARPVSNYLFLQQARSY